MNYQNNRLPKYPIVRVGYLQIPCQVASRWAGNKNGVESGMTFKTKVMWIEEIILPTITFCWKESRSQHLEPQTLQLISPKWEKVVVPCVALQDPQTVFEDGKTWNCCWRTFAPRHESLCWCTETQSGPQWESWCSVKPHRLQKAQMKIWSASAQEPSLWTNERSGSNLQSMTRRQWSSSGGLTINDLEVLSHRRSNNGKANRVSGLDRVFSPEQLQHWLNCVRSEVTASLNVTLKNGYTSSAKFPTHCKLKFWAKSASIFRKDLSVKWIF